jgi:uncharacterized protein (TIGR03083 family)
MTATDFVGFSWDDRPLHLRGALPDAAELLIQQRERLAGRLAGLSGDEWRQPTRCHLWDVADLVSHLTDTNRWILGALAAAWNPALPSPFEGFDNRVTPHEQVVAARGRTPAELLEDLRWGTEQTAKALAAGADPEFPLVRFAAARYRAPVAALHLLWDSFLHERDVLLPLGLGGDHTDDELTAMAAYVMLLAGIVMGPFDPPVTIDAVLHDRVDRSFRLYLGEAVRVEPLPEGTSPAEHRIEGPTLATIDALAGRGSLPDVLMAEAELGDRFLAVPARLRPA